MYSSSVESAQCNVLLRKAGILTSVDDSLLKKAESGALPKSHVVTKAMLEHWAQHANKSSKASRLEIFDGVSRVLGCALAETKGFNAVSVLFNQPTALPPEASPAPSTMTDVLQVVINAMPLPRGDMPIERIIEFRNDPERQRKFLALKRWMKEAVKRLPAESR